LTVFDNLFSFTNKGSDIIELVPIFLIWENCIPWGSLNCFFRHLYVFKMMYSAWIIKLCEIIFLHISFFKHEFIRLTQSYALKELRKVFINFNVFFLEWKTPSLKLFIKNLCCNYNENCTNCNHLDRSCPIDLEFNYVARFHSINLSFNLTVKIHEYYTVT
jgi:hypothetical protein